MLENLKKLKADMEKLGWTITRFTFCYKHVEYVVLVKRFLTKEEKKHLYALVELQFMRADDLSDNLICEANSKQLFIDVKTMRKYFGIEYSVNLGTILSAFINYFGQCVPINVREVISKLEIDAMIKALSLNDAEDPEKIYCKNVKRNAVGKKRSNYNSDKIRLLRASLYEKFKDDESISFCFSRNPEDHKSDEEILKRFAKSNGI